VAVEEAPARPRTARLGRERVRETLSGASLRELLIGGAHLGALWAFAFVQPLLDLLGKNADFWVARSNTAGDILIFSIGFTLLPPLVALAVEAVVKIVSERAYQALHLVLVALLFAVFAVEIQKKIYQRPAGLMIVVALALGALFAYGLYRRGFVKQLLDVLTPAPIVFLVIFIFFTNTHKLIFPAENASALGVKVPSNTPVVEVLFDEFPTATIMNSSGTAVDAKRFPGFARLASESTWYRNNSTVADFTGRAVPAIETGINPDFTTLPISSDQPDSIFSLLGGEYRFNVVEPVTDVCPPSLCPNGGGGRPPQRQRTRLKALVDDLKYVEGKLIFPPAMANDLPDVSATFGNFGNNGGSGQYAGQFAQDLFVPPSPGEFQSWAKRIPSGGRSFNFIHMELPHEPFHFLPDGRRYEYTPISDVAGPNAQKWAAGEGGVATTEQRHFIQTGYADRLTSLLIRDLKRRGLWDKALVVVTADHGISFDPRTYRRIAYPGDFGGIANSPLFIKYPDQKKGKVSEEHTRTIDVLPTIAQVLGVHVPYKTQGRPISDDGSAGPVTIKNGLKSTVSQPFAKMLAERRVVLQRNARRFGANTGLWQLGPASYLLGRPAPPLSGAGGSGSATLNKPEQWQNVKFGKGLTVPAFVAASLEDVPDGSLIAIAVNGRVAATCRSFLFDGDTWAGAVVPPQTLHRGHNSIGVYLIGPGGTLTPLGGN
jgi:Sulfatase